MNENDEKLLAFCINRDRTISEIARYLEIAPKNISVRLDRLAKLKKIRIEPGRGNKKYIRTLEGDKTKIYFLEILKEIHDGGGEISQDGYLQLMPFSFDKEDYQEKYSAALKMIYFQPKLIEAYYKITPFGKRFLKEYLKENQDKQVQEDNEE